MNSNEVYEKELSFQADRRRATVALIKTVSDLWYDNSIELVLFRNQLIDKNVSQIINLHEFAGEFVQKPISIFDSVEIAQAIKRLDLPPSRLDIGKLTYEYHLSNDEYITIEDFVQNKLKDAKKTKPISPKNVVLYGFGRIGRLVARELMTLTGNGNQLRLRAIVTRGKITPEILEKRASLLRNDSIHGDFAGTVKVDFNNQSLLINGTTVKFLSSESPETLDYTLHGIKDALVIDNSGAYRDKESLSRHLLSIGVNKVLVTAPAKGIPNIVHGVNHDQFDIESIDIFSSASCTTNAISPILLAIDESFGVINGHLETIHAYTNDQNLVDNMHSKYRRGRAAAINMIITETGAGKAITKVLPNFENKLTSNAIRVPVPNGSLAILKLNIDKKASKDAVNAIIKKYALEGNLVEQIKFSLDNELVSSDIVGSSAPAIYDSKATIVDSTEKNIILYVWYDNEYGYSHQVIRLAKHITKVGRFTYY